MMMRIMIIMMIMKMAMIVKKVVIAEWLWPWTLNGPQFDPNEFYPHCLVHRRGLKVVGRPGTNLKLLFFLSKIIQIV